MHNSFYIRFINKLDRRRVKSGNKACAPKAASYLNVLVRGGSSNSCLHNTAHISAFLQTAQGTYQQALLVTLHQRSQYR